MYVLITHLLTSQLDLAQKENKQRPNDVWCWLGSSTMLARDINSQTLVSI